MAKPQPKFKTPTSIKTINQKIRRLGRKYGTENIEYKNYIADIDRNFEVHYTKDGIIQIKTPKEMSTYQRQIMVKLQKRKGIRELESDSKKRLKASGIDKPTKEQIQEEVVKFTERQSAIDDTLEAIYIDERDGTLPSDIAFIYAKIHRRGKGAGSGISNNELDEMIQKMKRWGDIKSRLFDLAYQIKALDYVDDEILVDIKQASTGRMTLSQIEELIPQLEEYLQQRTT